MSLGESDISVAAVDVWGNASEQIVKVIRTTSQQALPMGVRTPATPTVVKIVDTTPPVIETVSGLKTNMATTMHSLLAMQIINTYQSYRLQ